MKKAITLIAQEREEQIKKHEFTIAYDLQQNSAKKSGAPFPLAEAAMGVLSGRKEFMPYNWPPEKAAKACKKSYHQRLTIAGALIAAELDRLIAEESKNPIRVIDEMELSEG